MPTARINGPVTPWRGVEVIRYASDRHSDHNAKVVVLSCAAFAQPAPISTQTWQIMLSPSLMRAHCETKRQSFMFGVGETQLTWPDH